MSKKDDKKEVKEVKDQARVEKPDNVPVSREELATPMYQKDSPAYDLSPVGSENAINTVAEEKAAEEESDEKKEEKVSQAEYDRRTKLDVSDPDYINPSLDHTKAK